MSRNFRETGERMKRSESGAVLILVAIALLMLLAFMALAIDVGFMYTAKADLQTCVDAAALAGASGISEGPSVARARAIDYAARNPVYGKTVDLKASDIEFGLWDPDAQKFGVLAGKDEGLANAIRVTGNLTKGRSSSLPLIFAGAVGVGSADVRAQSTARALTGNPWDIVVLQDITGSFAEELDTALEADRNMVACVAESTGGDSRIGFAVHTGLGKVMTSLRTVDDGFADINLIIDGVGPCGSKNMPACSGTDQAAGMDAALKIFSTSKPNPVANAKKAILLVSDGKPNADKQGAHPKLNDKQLQALALTRADDAWAKGINVFTVFYDEDNDNEAANFLEDMTRGIGTFQRTPDPKDLDSLLTDVCSALGNGVRLVE